MEAAADKDPSISQLEQDWISMQKSFKAFCKQLGDFPHSFQLENQESLLSDQLKRVQGALETALAVGYQTSLETARARNLLAYVYFQLGQRTEALEQTEMVLGLEGQQKNLVSLANKAVILWRMEHRTEAQEQAEKLMAMKRDLSDFSYLEVKAKAELAFSYTRFDPSFYPLAKTLYSEVILEARDQDLWLWKFGLAFTRRRMLRPLIKEGSNDHQDHPKVLDLYLEIIQKCASDSLRAKAYAEIAVLLYIPRSADFREILQKQADMTVPQACSSALEYDDKDNSVLWKCGKMYRYLRRTEESRELLEKAVSRRPTSKAYHHLGLTYKALATKEKKKLQREGNAEADVDNVSEIDFQRFKTQLSRSASDESQPNIGQTPLARPLSGSEQNTEMPAGGDACVKDDKQFQRIPESESSYHAADKSTKEAFEFWKIVKSPLDDMTTFCKGDPFINEAIESLTRAVEVSHWENAGAVYDLALLLRSMGDLEQARYYLERSLSKEHCLGVFTKINVFEQLGLIFADMAGVSSCEKESKRLTEKSQSMLLMALKTASERYGSIASEIWHSFPALMDAVSKTEKSSAGRLRDKAILFRLIRNNRKSLAILQDIEKMDPKEGNDPVHLKICIENYVEMHKFEDALVFVDLLQCTSQHEKVSELFEDDQFLGKVYLKAAKQSLMQGSPNFKLHVRAIFNNLIPRDVCTSSEDTDADDKAGKPTWDVHILHEEREEDTKLARGLTSIFVDLCGLKVTRNDDDVMGGFYLDGVLNIIRKSKVVAVVIGSQKLSRELRFFIDAAARCAASVTLLTNGVRVPKVMATHRSLHLPPPDLLQVSSTLEPGQVLSPDDVATVCQLLGFLADTKIE